jgi:hypothetical protein
MMLCALSRCKIEHTTHSQTILLVKAPARTSAPRFNCRQRSYRVATQAARERLTPLEERLSRLLATIPSEIQREGLSLASLQASLWGRWRGNCHPGELGTALRKLGFTRQRRWHDEGCFRALWYPTQ